MNESGSHSQLYIPNISGATFGFALDLGNMAAVDSACMLSFSPQQINATVPNPVSIIAVGVLTATLANSLGLTVPPGSGLTSSNNIVPIQKFAQAVAGAGNLTGYINLDNSQMRGAHNPYQIFFTGTAQQVVIPLPKGINDSLVLVGIAENLSGVVFDLVATASPCSTADATLALVRSLTKPKYLTNLHYEASITSSSATSVTLWTAASTDHFVLEKAVISIGGGVIGGTAGNFAFSLLDYDPNGSGDNITIPGSSREIYIPASPTTQQTEIVIDFGENPYVSTWTGAELQFSALPSELAAGSAPIWVSVHGWELLDLANLINAY